jgi:hypothetical protein
MLPSTTTHDFRFNGLEGPRAISIQDSALVAWGRENDISGDLYAVEKVEVTCFFDGETPPHVSAYGRRLTKAGIRDKRETTLSLVSMDDEDDERFIKYAQAVMK